VNRIDGTDAPMERAVIAAVPFLVIGLVLSLPLLFTSSATTTTVVTLHLGGLVVLGLLAAFRLEPLAGGGWFLGHPWSPFWRLSASGVAVVFLVTGVVGLVTLTSSAALRYPPSMQFLQLLSALDIAWAATALIVGLRRGWGRGVAIAGSAALAAVCVWAIWRYLDVVGLGPDGEWIVDAGALFEHVLPYDTAAAIAAVAAFLLGTRRAAQAIEQASPQS
jgi:hypothetical protein